MTSPASDRAQLVVDDVTGDVVERGDALAAISYAIGTLQLDVPLPLPESFSLGSALFVDFGTLGYLDAANRQTVDLVGSTRLIIDDSASLRVAAGVSVFWDSPFGPVQFDFAQPLQYEDYDRREQFRFSTRTSF
ncbi:MAG: BamA/TamA family outer membrane protein [Caulobacteraceae bacterium]|nr:BamA/TamA family outer membrane protein [Caulobacteraceae bacterium]